MIIDSKGKLFGKISIIDIIVVLFILGLGLGVFYKFTKSDTVSVFNKPDSLIVVLFIEETPDYTKNAINIGDPVREVVQNSLLGTVTEVKAGKSVSFGVNDQGIIVQSSKAGYESLEITLKGEGIYGNGGVTFGSSAFYVGKFYEIKVGNAGVYGRIKSIRKID